MLLENDLRRRKQTFPANVGSLKACRILVRIVMLYGMCGRYALYDPIFRHNVSNFHARSRMRGIERMRWRSESPPRPGLEKLAPLYHDFHESVRFTRRPVERTGSDEWCRRHSRDRRAVPASNVIVDLGASSSSATAVAQPPGVCQKSIPLVTERRCRSLAQRLARATSRINRCRLRRLARAPLLTEHLVTSTSN